MDESLVKEFVGETVSVLLTIPKQEGGDKRETYNGTIREVRGGIVIIDTNNPKFHIKTLLINVKLIDSMWIYKKNEVKKHFGLTEDEYGRQTN